MEDQRPDQKSTNVKPAYTLFLLPGAIILAALLISGTLFFTVGKRGTNLAQVGGAMPEAKVADLKIKKDDHVLGDPSAKVTIFEFSDFQCSFCRKFWEETMVQLKKEYIDSGKASLVYKHYPLDFHSGAVPAAESSECAGDQDKFWEMHDKIFEEQAKQGDSTIQFSAEDLENWASQIGLDMTKFNQCLDDGKFAKKVSGDLAEGTEVGINGTPTFFINGQKIIGAQPYSVFKTAIDSFLK